MENNNQPPFAVGQKIVRTGHAVPGIVEEGGVYTAHDCAQCKCKTWHVYIQELPSISNSTYCPKCNGKLPNRTKRCGFASEFAPLNPPRVSAIPELLKAPVEETLDVHKVKVLSDVPK